MTEKRILVRKHMGDLLINLNYPFGIFFKDYDFSKIKLDNKETIMKCSRILEVIRERSVNSKIYDFESILKIYNEVINDLQEITENWQEYEVSVWVALILSISFDKVGMKTKKFQKKLQRNFKKFGNKIIEQGLLDGFNKTWFINNSKNGMQTMFDILIKYKEEFKNQDIPADIKALILFILIQVNTQEILTTHLYGNDTELLDDICFRVHSSLKRSILSSTEIVLELRTKINELKTIPTTILHLIIIIYTLTEITT